MESARDPAELGRPLARRGRKASASRRLRLAAVAPVIIVAGAAMRYGLDGWPADAGGGIAYAALAYVVLAWIWPVWPAGRVAALALAVSVAVEGFQLTGIPSAWADAWAPIALVFGSGFAAADLPPYVVGASLAWLIDQRVGGARGVEHCADPAAAEQADTVLR